MDANLHFDLNDHDDRMAHNRCVKATNMAIVIWEFRYNIRNQENLTLEKAYEEFNRLLEEQEIHIDELLE